MPRSMRRLRHPGGQKGGRLSIQADGGMFLALSSCPTSTQNISFSRYMGSLVYSD